MQHLTPEVCPDAARIVAGILRGMRRRGLPANVDVDDLRQEGMIALIDQTGPECLLAKIAKNAMIDHIKEKQHECLGMSALKTDDYGEFVPPVEQRDAFFILPVDDGKAYRSRKARMKTPIIETLASRHQEWERERAERWA